MKIYQINCSSYGSTGKLALALHNRLLKDGNESRVGYGYGKCNLQGTYRISNWFDTHVHDRLSRYTGLIGWFSVLCTLRLLQDVTKFNPDIIHLHNLHGNYVNVSILLRYLRRSKRKVLFTLHDCWAFTGKCPHFTLIGCNKWKDTCHNCPLLKDFPSSDLFDTSKLLFNQKKKLLIPLQNMRLVTVSEWLAGVTKQSFLRTKQIDVVSNGIDISIFRIKDIAYLKAKLKLSDKFILLGVASTWGNRKNLEKWLLLRNALDDNYSIVLVGLNKNQVLDLPSGMIAIEKTENQEELADYYNMADVLINMSKEESFGLVTIEAMACGTPVIAYNSTANPELVAGDRGIVIDNDEVDAMKKAVEQMKAVGKTYFSKNCRSFAENGYTIDTMYNKYKKLYNEMVL